MPFCKDIDNLTVDMFKDSGTLLDSLLFKLVIRGGVIKDDPRTGSTMTVGLQTNPVSGTCRSVAKPDVSVVDMTFMWDALEISMTGIIFKDDNDQRTKFLGRFQASRTGPLAARKSVGKKRADDDAVLAGPSDGDTGTGTGSQTLV